MSTLFTNPTSALAIALLAGGLVGISASRAAAQTPPDDKSASRLVLNDEPDWNAAENAAAASQWDAATDAYQKVLRTTQKPWLKTRAAVRLLDVAAKAKRYDTVVNAYLTLVRTDPAQALSRRPTLPDGDSAYVDTAIDATAKALGESPLTDDQKQALLSLQLDLYRIRKDDARADQVLAQLNALTASPTSGTGSARRFADTKLTAARLSFDRRDYAGTLAAVVAARPAITDPGQQEEALFLMAQALDGQAAGANDPPAALKDTGLAYMRVVAHFQDIPANRHVADALAGCASVLERLRETKIAADLYEQAAIQYDTRPEAQAARASSRRLRGAAGTTRASTTP